MKKSIIAAGAASVALAAMPIVGAMAVANFTDTIKVNIADTCAFTRDASTPHPQLHSETWNPTGTTVDELSSVTVPLNTETDIASSKFHVVCNDVDGYQVTVAASSLDKPGTTTPTVTASASMAYNNTTAGVAGTWRLTSDGEGQNIGVSNGDRVIYEEATTTGRDFNITYYVMPGASQAAGIYTGTAAYTFATLPVSGS